MAARKRPSKARAIIYKEEDEGSPEPKRQAPDCLAYVEPISPIFDPERVLLRRVFFVNADKSKYVSVGFYPARNYKPMVEFGSGEVTRLFSVTLKCATYQKPYPACANLCVTTNL
jgi:hypothetical protein